MREIVAGISYMKVCNIFISEFFCVIQQSEVYCYSAFTWLLGGGRVSEDQ